MSLLQAVKQLSLVLQPGTSPRGLITPTQTEKAESSRPALSTLVEGHAHRASFFVVDTGSSTALGDSLLQGHPHMQDSLAFLSSRPRCVWPPPSEGHLSLLHAFLLWLL